MTAGTEIRIEQAHLEISLISMLYPIINVSLSNSGLTALETRCLFVYRMYLSAA